MSIKGVAASTAAEKSNVRVPAWSLVILSIISVEAGAAIAKSLFDSVGPVGVIFIRTLLGSAMLWALARPRLTGYTRREWGWLIAYGVVIALNMLVFYGSIARIPLGIAVAIAFAGPLVLAVIHSRKLIDVLWVVLAGGGILLLTPLTSAALDPLGVALSLLCAVLWGLYIILTGRVSRSFPGMSALAIAMGVAALLTLPFGAPGALTVLTNWQLIAVALFVALLSSAIPFALEFIAMKTLPTRALSLLLALEPVAAALVGLVLLNEHLGLREMIGISLVTIAAIATAYESR